MWGVVIGCVIIILFLLIVIRISTPNINDVPESKIFMYDDIKDKLESGDLVFLAGKTYTERLACWHTNCPFSHVGMIMKNDIDGKPYIWEADIGQGAKKGTRLMLLDEKLARYKGFRKGAILKLRALRSINNEDIAKIIKEHEGQDMDTMMATHVTSGFPRSYIHNIFKDDNKIFCSELIADTYQKLALMKTTQDPSYYTPKDFFTSQVPLQEGVKLDEPIYFSF